MALPAVVVVADDLIWTSRLVAAVERAGARAVRVASTAQLEAERAADDVAGTVVDLNGRRYDGVEAVAAAARSGRPVIAVGQHEDVELRKRALAAGAIRVFSYNKFFSDGPSLVASWLLRTEPAAPPLP